MIQVKSAEQLEQEAQEEQQKRIDNQNAAQNTMRVADSLAAYVRSKWETAKSHKLHVTDRLNDCLRRRKGEYSPTRLEQIKSTGGSDIYMNITGTKVIGAKAWLSDLFASDKPFSLDPTPVEDLPPELHERLLTEAMQGALQMGIPEEIAYQLMQKHKKRLQTELRMEAEERMEKMEDYVHDVLVEGGFREAFDQFLDDFTTYPTAIMSGVNLRHKKQVEWVEINGQHVPKKKMVISKEVRRVSPYDAYPSPTLDHSNDSYMIEHMRFSPSDLADLRNAPGYKAEAIYRALYDYRQNGHREWLFNSGERDKLEGKHTAFSSEYDLIDGIKFSGKIQGKQLIEWGMDKRTIPDPVMEYDVSVIVIGSYTIRALVNPDPEGGNSYYFASWRNVPGSFWGQALPETIADVQDAANATARTLINNMAMGSAPQVAVDVSMLPQGQSVGKITPWRIWAYDGTKGRGGAGINFFMPEIKANELLTVYERFVRYADEQSGIPSYAFGSDGGAGAAKTASGLSMLMNAASKVMKSAVRNIDINLIEPLTRNIFNILMLDPEVPSEIKGDCKVRARGSDALMHKESAAMRQQELLQLTNNPVDLQITGLDGRKELMRNVLSSADVKPDRIIPEMDELQQQQQMMQQQGQQPQQGQPNE